jgi:hypothetical protein
LELRAVGNDIVSNGINSGLSGTGLVIRVGTSDASGSMSDPGGFASSGSALNLNASAATFFATAGAASQRGGVIAQIDSNTLGGNFGNDVLFNSFTSTVNPVPATGTWSNNLTATPPTFTFTVTSAYQSDPLSRFDLYFRNNTTNPGSFDPLGVSLGGYATRNPALVAFYNNPDAVFKSPTGVNGANTGPFTATDRARNATRQAATIPGFVGSPPYLFPGMGASTWRVFNSSGTAANNSVDGTLFNANNVNANNLFLSNPASNGETSYTFGTF